MLLLPFMTRSAMMAMALVLYPFPLVRALGNNAGATTKEEDTLSLSSSSTTTIMNTRATLLRGGNDNINIKNGNRHSTSKRNLQDTIIVDPYARDNIRPRRIQYDLHKVLIAIQASSVPDLTSNDLVQLAASLGPTYNNKNPCTTIGNTFLIEPSDLQERIDSAVMLYEKGIITHGRFTLLVGVNVPTGSMPAGSNLFLYSGYSDYLGGPSSCSIPLATQVANSLPTGPSIEQVLDNQEFVPVSEEYNGGFRRLEDAEEIEFVSSIDLGQTDAARPLSPEQKNTLEEFIKAEYNEMNQGDPYVNDPYDREVVSVDVIEVEARRRLTTGAGPPIWLKCLVFGRCKGCPRSDPLCNDTSDDKCQSNNPPTEGFC